MFRRREKSESERAAEARNLRRQFALAGTVAAVGALGALPSATGEPDPLGLLFWLTLWAPAAGWVVGARGLSLWPVGLAVPALWMGVLVIVDAGSARDLPTPLWAALAWTGFFALGMAGGRLFPGAAWRGAGALLLAGGLLAGLPSGWGRARAPWPPRATSLLIDVSPPAVIMESAGVDWMRRPGLYEPAGTDRFVRRPYRGLLAGPTLLLVGCLAAVVAGRLRRGAPRGSFSGENSWSTASTSARSRST